MSDTCPVLTYHSISAGAGPTNIAPAQFAMQMGALAEAGYRTLTLDQFIAWHDGDRTPSPDKAVLITFDDAFRDFAEQAVPVLQQHGFCALVFVPTAKLGGMDDWESGAPPRPLLRWDEIRALQAQGFEFGSHSRSHRDLRTLEADALADEVGGSRQELAEQLATVVRGFAAPFGTTDKIARREIAHHYDVAFGTRLALARRGHDRYDLPRLDMHYFRDSRHWRDLLAGRTMYLKARQCLRAVRRSVQAVAGGGKTVGGRSV